MALPVKHSVAVMIFNQGRVLAIRRSELDDELPGIWGLPAGTCRENESIPDVIERIGKDKLDVILQPVRKITSGVQDRASYRLEMELWEASIIGEPKYPEWQWSDVNLLRPGALAGSLCCELALKSKSRVR